MELQTKMVSIQHCPNTFLRHCILRDLDQKIYVRKFSDPGHAVYSASKKCLDSVVLIPFLFVVPSIYSISIFIFVEVIRLLYKMRFHVNFYKRRITIKKIEEIHQTWIILC